MDGSPSPFAGLSPDSIFQKLLEAGEAWAEAQAVHSFYENLEKSLLAQLTIRKMQHRDVSRAQAEQEARASDEYNKHVREGITASLKANKAKVRYDSARVWVDLMRSQNANRRTEMQLGGLVS